MRAARGPAASGIPLSSLAGGASGRAPDSAQEPWDEHWWEGNLRQDPPVCGQREPSSGVTPIYERGEID